MTPVPNCWRHNAPPCLALGRQLAVIRRSDAIKLVLKSHQRKPLDLLDTLFLLEVNEPAWLVNFVAITIDGNVSPWKLPL